MRTCKVCNVEKPLSEFPMNRGYSLHTCKECYSAKNRERTAAYYARNHAARLEAMSRRYKMHKDMVFAHYGAKCSCCGEDEPMFLTIDHVNCDGKHHRRKPGNSSHNNIYGWLVRNQFPDGFQVLCNNCNHGRYRNNGVCPHKEGASIIP
jgi:hypothetical protein